MTYLTILQYVSGLLNAVRWVVLIAADVGLVGRESVVKSKLLVGELKSVE
jgi:hypothetical protein